MEKTSLPTVSARSLTNGVFWGALCSGGIALTLFAVIAPQLRQLPNLKNIPPLFSKNYFWIPLTGTGVALFTISLFGARFTASHITASPTIAPFLNDKGVADSFFHHIHSFSHLPGFKVKEAEATLTQIRAQVGQEWQEQIDTTQPLGRQVRLTYELLFANPRDLLVNGTPINATQQLHLFFAMLDRIPQAEGYDAAVEAASQEARSKKEPNSSDEIQEERKDELEDADTPYEGLKGFKNAQVQHVHLFTKVCYAVTLVDNSQLRHQVYEKIPEQAEDKINKIPESFQNQTKRRFLILENKIVSWAGSTWIAGLFLGERFCPVESGNVPTRWQQETYSIPPVDEHGNATVFQSNMVRAGCGMKDTSLGGSRFHGWTQGLIDYHYLRDETLLYVNHQDARHNSLLGTLLKTEPTRVRSMVEGGGIGPKERRERNRRTMLVVSLPMSGPIYKGKTEVSVEGLKKNILEDMFNDNKFQATSEFYLPVNAIHLRYKKLHPSKDLDIYSLVSDSLNHIHTTYFKDVESLDSTQRKAFILLFYVELTRQIAAHTQSPLQWKACKNAIDRAMVNNMLARRTAIQETPPRSEADAQNDNDRELLNWPGISTRGRMAQEKHTTPYHAAKARVQEPAQHNLQPNPDNEIEAVRKVKRATLTRVTPC